MSLRAVRLRSATGLFTVYATVTLILVLMLGVALALAVRHEAERRGLAEGRSEALLVAQTAVEHHLDGRLLSEGLSPDHLAELETLTRRAVGEGTLLRLRIRDLNGTVVFADDGSGGRSAIDDEVVRATNGEIVALITRLNTDVNDEGPVGAEAVEVYAPLKAGDPMRQVGVLEVYLPYAPIADDISRGTNQLYLVLAGGLLLLYIALFLVSLSVTRRL
ncbi:MAG: hypothetical protein PHU75_10450, partial [Candidatus Nanopelagicales bacterium]|nr:hypothetical protein [Candidatus Nanopelagicales bacterium]